MARFRSTGRIALSLVLLALVCLVCAGCLSSHLGRASGDEMIWYCDRCQAQVGSPDTHVCGMTEYDAASKSDQLIEGFTREEYEEELARRRETAHPAEEGAPVDVPRRRSPRWMFWRR